MGRLLLMHKGKDIKLKQKADNHLSIDEVMEFISRLTKSDHVRLAQFARVRASGLMDGAWEDLLNTAFERVIRGSRQWPRGLNVHTFFFGVLRSIADEMRSGSKKISDHATSTIQHDDGSLTDIVDTLPSPTNPSPEERLVMQERLEEIEDMFAEDEHGFAVILARTEGLSPAEAQEQFEMTPTEYASAMKRVRRAFLKSGLVRNQP